MKKLFLIIALLLSTVTSVDADWIRVPATGTGKPRVDPYRPVLPNGIKAFSGVPIEVNGVPTHFIVWVNEFVPPTTVGVTKLTRAEANSQLANRGVRITQIEKLPTPSPIRDTARRLWKKIYSYISPAVAWAVSASDNFNRPSGGLGANWTTTTDDGAPAIVSDTIVQPAGADTLSGAYYNAMAPNANQWGQVEIITWGGSGFPVVTLLLRQATDATTYYSCTVRDFSGDGSDPIARISKVITGTETLLASSATLSPAPTGGDEIYCENVDGSFSMKQNTVELLTTSNSDIAAAGRIGFKVYGSAATDAQIDNWSGGDFVSAGNAAKRIIIVQ